MSLQLLSDLLENDSSHTVSFSEDGSTRTWLDFIALSAAVFRPLSELAETRWAIDLDDPFEFAAALVGVWAADKVAVIAPGPLLHGRDSDINMDGLLTSTAAGTNHWTTINLNELELSGREELRIASDAELALYTSGSTGKPKVVCRNLHNIEAELATLHSLWTDEQGSGTRVFSTVSHRHVYGLLFRLIWPLLARRPFADYDLVFPEQLRKSETNEGILVASPALLKRIGHLNSGTCSWDYVFSSGGFLSLQAASESRRILGVCPIEVLGSTETSGVGWRAQFDQTHCDWRILPQVRIRASENSFLEVKSPFSGSPDWLTMGDHVRIKSDTTFELLGRGDHIAKIEDKRVSLGAIEQLLTDSPWIADAAAVALDQSGRQFVGVVLQPSGRGWDELERLGKLEFAKSLKSLLGMIEPVAIPKLYRYVDAIPVNQQGKRESAALSRLFE